MSVSVTRLERWLVEDPDRLERYLTRHPDAAELLEQSTALASDIRAALTEALSIPSGLAERLLADARQAGDSAAPTVVLDLMASGIATLRLLSGLD